MIVQARRHMRICALATILGAVHVAAASGYDAPVGDCWSRFQQLRQGLLGSIEGGKDNHGNPVDIMNATAMTYALCVKTCGTGIWEAVGGQPGRWLTFSQAFSTWLLPFLALVSQLPFGGDTMFENIVSILLNVGSPTLAAYSATLTVLNSRWIHRRFSGISYPNVHSAVQVFNNLQQSPVKVTRNDYLLSSLIVLPENDQWWSELLLLLDLKHGYTWSFSYVASIGWVVAAFSLTVINGYTNIIKFGSGLDANGLGVGFVWLWLFAVSTCCLNTGPRCDTTALRDAIQRANHRAYVATDIDDAVPFDSTEYQPALSLYTYHKGLRTDEQRTAPIYNYARLLPWSLAVEHVYAAFRAASHRAGNHIPVRPDIVWTKGPKDELDPANRRGSLTQVAAYIQYIPGAGDTNHEIPDVRSRSLTASFMALSLTWGTIGSAILLEWSTPTKGLGCRSGSYLIYLAISTCVWAMIMVSTQLTYPSIVSPATNSALLSTKPVILIRRTAKLLACLNAIWIVLSCLFQFSGVFGTCWCQASAFYLGPRAYAVMFFTKADLPDGLPPLVFSTALASASVAVFVGMNIYLNPAASR
ncbi:hypothetical protein C8R44DRAFT_657908 [Mycena epipterygia]|nr:hypothetical protein C8R44DRAFT_657908 [Mycena epipterygia]